MFALLSFAALSLAEAKSADTLMAEAFARAKSEKKTVLLSFQASWCGWCHKLEDFLKLPEIKPIWDKRIVTVWLTVMESSEKKSNENPGGADWLKKVGGEGSGIPFMAIFDNQGKMKINSTRPADKSKPKDTGGNTGYPAAPEEIAWFMTMLKDAVPNMTAKERSIIETKLKSEAKKLKM